MSIPFRFPALGAAAATLLLAVAASGGPILPVSYDLPNGESGGFSYHDDGYTGSGDSTVDGAALTGGLGQLTDGFISTQTWIDDPAPWVGWVRFDPVITFRFDGVHFISAMSLHVDDANGLGAVSPPDRITLSDGVGTFVFPVVDPAGELPFWIDLNNLNLLGPWLEVTVHRRTELDGADECTPCQWTFLDEVTFFGERVEEPVPEPSTWALMLGALGVLSWIRRTRNANGA